MVFNVIFQSLLEQRWELVITVCYVLWIITSLSFALGKIGYLPSYESVIQTEVYPFSAFMTWLKNRNIHDLAGFLVLDLRYVFSALMLLLLMADSLSKTLRTPIPDIPRLSSFNLQSKQALGFFGAVLWPFLVVIKTLLTALFFLLDTIWRLVTLTVFYLYQFSYNLINRIFKLFTHSVIWLSLVKVFFTLSIILLFSYGLKWLSGDFLAYLSSPTAITTLATEEIIQLIEMAVFFIMTLMGVSIYHCLWFGFSERYFAINRATIAGTTLFLAITFSAGISYALHQLGWLEIKGFERMGTVLLSVIVLLIFLALLVVGKQFQAQSSSEQQNVSQHAKQRARRYQCQPKPFFPVVGSVIFVLVVILIIWCYNKNDL